MAQFNENTQTVCINHQREMVDHRTPFDELADAEDAPDDENITLANISDIPRDALARLLDFLMGHGQLQRKRWRCTQLRTAALAHMLNVQDLRELSLEELGEQLGCTRALLSLYQLRIVDGLGLDKTINGKQRPSRETYRQTATAYHARAGHKMTVKP